MKTLYLECNMGAAGDMLMAALLELHPHPDQFLRQLNGAGIPNVTVTAIPAVKCGITGTHISVRVGDEEEHSVDVDTQHLHEHSHVHHDHGHAHTHEHDHTHGHPHSHEHAHEHGHEHAHGHTHHHNHSGMADIAQLINGLHISARVKADALAVYQLIAQAESHAHGVPVSEIHFHEVGTMDAVADVVGVSMLMEAIAPERVVASPVHTGSGQVRCAHGVLPVPTPATAFLLAGIPIYSGQVRGELCTPTGAALLKHFVNAFGAMPVMQLQKTGYGMGQKDFEAANCVRAFLGETDSPSDEVTQLSCNLDDMTPEAVAFAQQQLLEAGALDVYTIPIGMKKGRSGTLLTCMCRSGETEKFVRLLFAHTTTLGLRECVSRRHVLTRAEHTVQTGYGPVRVKTAQGYGVEKSKPEYEDLAAIARAQGLPLADVCRAVHEADEQQR